jgi:serine/threonine-protein kinase
MGVYRATDTNVKRQGAIKVLPLSLAADPERLARFQREAEVLAALNHPNIAHIHGLAKSDGTKALVMALVEGPTLRSHRPGRHSPRRSAADRQADRRSARSRARAKDRPPRSQACNIKVRPDGTVKLLDLALRRRWTHRAPSSADAVNSPTISMHATQAGMILGTAAYMSPEQARGRAVDKRADIWAFGCVLYDARPWL